ncbi:ankyrin repeat domain-containing protein [Fluoribacter gormanii]|uniref:ankyrin repeat domain-containing protein n=1 Tax=Fluoribacter gormanii TaxID=464 RepID=UPI0010415BEB|nr:ankyrin repeat domain-containing protein [Fluoribacter gormanii]
MLTLIKIYQTSGLSGVKKYLQDNNINLMNNNSIDEVNADGFTALFLACMNNHVDLVRFLLEHGANPNYKTRSGYTPLFYAASETKIKLINLLLEYHADPHVLDSTFTTPLDLAKKARNWVYYHDQFEFASELEKYEWLIDEYKQLDQIVKKMEACPIQSPPPLLKDFKTLTQEGMAIPDLSNLGENDLLRLGSQLQLSFQQAESQEKIQFPINYNMSPPELIHSILKKYPGMIVGENHGCEAPKRFLIDNLNLLADEGVSTIFLEHLCIEECSELLESYLTSPDDAELPEPLKTRLYDQDYHRELKDSPYNFTNLVKAVKQYNLSHPDKLIRIVLFDTKTSYGIMGSTSDTKRERTMNYLAHIAIEKEKSRFEASNPGKEFKYVGFMGETHTNTFNDSIGVAVYQKVPGILIDQIDDEKRPVRAPLRHPDYRYWMFSKPEAASALNDDDQLKMKYVLNLLQYIDTLSPYVSAEEELNKINNLFREVLELKGKPSKLNNKLLENIISRLVGLSPEGLREDYKKHSSLTHKLNQILAQGVQSQEEYEEILMAQQFIQSNPLPTRDNQSELSRITKLMDLYELRGELFKEYNRVLHLTNRVQNELAKKMLIPDYNLSVEKKQNEVKLIKELQERRVALNEILTKAAISQEEQGLVISKNFTSLYQHIDSTITHSIGHCTSLEMIPQPEYFSSIVWANLIVASLRQILEHDTELSELQFESADKAHEKLLYPLYNINEHKRKDILISIFNQVAELSPKNRKEFLRYLHLQLSKQEDGRNDEQIKKDINFLLNCENNPPQKFLIRMQDIREQWEFILSKDTIPFIPLFASADSYTRLANYILNLSGKNPPEYFPILKTFAMQFLFSDVDPNTQLDHETLVQMNTYLEHLISMYFDSKMADTLEGKQMAQREIYRNHAANLWANQAQAIQSETTFTVNPINFYAFAEHLYQLREFARLNMTQISQNKVNFFTPKMVQEHRNKNQNYILQPSITRPGALNVQFKETPDNEYYQSGVINVPHLLFWIMDADISTRYSIKDYLQTYLIIEKEYKELCQNTGLSYAENYIRNKINNIMGGAPVVSPAHPINSSYPAVGLFGTGYAKKENALECLVLENTFRASYNEIATAFPQLNWPVIDNINLKFVQLEVKHRNNQFELNLSLLESSNNNNNNAYSPNNRNLTIPPLLAQALIQINQSQNLLGLLSSMPEGSIHINNRDPSAISIYIKHAQGIHQYSLQTTSTNTLVDQNNNSYQNLSSFIATAVALHQLPQIHTISTLDLLGCQLNILNQEDNQYYPPQPI